MWIIFVIIALLIWGNLSKKSAAHPLNSVVSPKPQQFICRSTSTAGDNFGSGCAIVSGVTEHCNAANTGINTPAHVMIPIDPPPLAIQNPTPAAPRLSNGTYIRASGPEVDIFQNGVRRWVPNPATFTAMGGDWNKIVTLTDTQFNALPKGSTMPDLTPAPAPTVAPSAPQPIPVFPFPVAPRPAPVAPIRSAGGLLWGTSNAPVNKPVNPKIWCGNGIGWCTDKLNQLAGSHCWAAKNTGCGAF